MKLFGLRPISSHQCGIAPPQEDVVDPELVMAENAYRMLTNRVLNVESRATRYGASENNHKERIGYQFRRSLKRKEEWLL